VEPGCIAPAALAGFAASAGNAPTATAAADNAADLARKLRRDTSAESDSVESSIIHP
jgi:hypothetical protein